MYIHSISPKQQREAHEPMAHPSFGLHRYVPEHGWYESFGIGAHTARAKTHEHLAELAEAKEHAKNNPSNPEAHRRVIEATHTALGNREGLYEHEIKPLEKIVNRHAKILNELEPERYGHPTTFTSSSKSMIDGMMAKAFMPALHHKIFENADPEEVHRQYAAAHHHLAMRYDPNSEAHKDHMDASERHLVAADAHMMGHPKAGMATSHALRGTAQTMKRHKALDWWDHPESIHDHAKVYGDHANTTSAYGSESHKDKANRHRIAAGLHRFSLHSIGQKNLRETSPFDPGVRYGGIHALDINNHTTRARYHDQMADLLEAKKHAWANPKDPEAHKRVIEIADTTLSNPEHVHGPAFSRPAISHTELEPLRNIIDHHTERLRELEGTNKAVSILRSRMC